jgi:bacterioferritin (cytochrome b1)
MKCLTSRLLFLEGAPTIDPKPAATHDSIGDILNGRLRRRAGCRRAFTDPLQAVLRGRRHVELPLLPAPFAKWHREGDDKFKGHLCWLQKQLYQLKKLGENDYIAVNAVKE